MVKYSDRFPERRHGSGVGRPGRDRQITEEPLMAHRRPRLVDRPFDLKPVERDSGADMLGGSPADLPNLETTPGNRDWIEHDRFMGIEPGNDFMFAGRKRRGCERGQQSAAILLLALPSATNEPRTGRTQTMGEQPKQNACPNCERQ